MLLPSAKKCNFIYETIFVNTLIEKIRNEILAEFDFVQKELYRPEKRADWMQIQSVQVRKIYLSKN